MSQPSDEDTSREGRVDTGRFWKLLRSVPAPNGERDLVQEGVVRELDEQGGTLSIRLADDIEGEDLVDLAASLRETFDGVDDVEKVNIGTGDGGRADPVTPLQHAESDGDGGSRPMTPLQAELLEEGRVPEPDPIGQSQQPPNVAPDAGYEDESGPDPLEGPGGIGAEDARAAEWEGEMPVFQWDIDPQAPDAATGEAELEEDDWEFRLWWQEHDAGLVYANLRAIRDDQMDRGGEARAHAVGRAVVVNLVYDPQREGIVALYGTARDFRPFVDAFEEAYVDRKPDE